MGNERTSLPKRWRRSAGVLARIVREIGIVSPCSRRRRLYNLPGHADQGLTQLWQDLRCGNGNAPATNGDVSGNGCSL